MKADDMFCSAQEEGTAEDVPGRLPRRPMYAPAPMSVRLPETDRLQRWDHGLTKWRMRQCLVSCTHVASLMSSFTN